jgi:ribosomal protein S12 methylthiotransferase accessory factor
LSTIGITRVADITGLDRIGIPTYSVVRPTSKLSAVTVTCGKGVRHIDAKVGAVMESIEYKLGEPDPERGVLARYVDLKGSAVHPSEFHAPPWVKDGESKVFEWVQGWDIARDEPVWVPAASVYILEPRGDFLFTTESTGFASGNCMEEAICHGLAEVIERDADSIAASHGLTKTAAGRYPRVELESCPASSRELIEHFQRNEIDVFVQNITSDIGIACFDVVCADRRSDKLLVHGGSGAHMIAEIALNRGLTEAAQSRAADIQGSREDLTYFRRAQRDPRRHDPTQWTMPDTGWCRFENVPSKLTGDVADDIAFMIARLRERGFTRVVVVDLTSAELGLPTARVIVPGLEIASVDPWRSGPRLSKGAEKYDEQRWTL